MVVYQLDTVQAPERDSAGADARPIDRKEQVRSKGTHYEARVAVTRPKSALLPL